MADRGRPAGFVPRRDAVVLETNRLLLLLIRLLATSDEEEKWAILQEAQEST